MEESLSDSKGGDVFFGFEKRLGERDHKWTADVRRSHNSRLSRAEFLDVSLVPDATVDEVSTFNGQDNQNTRWIAQTDFERPWGEEGKLEAGWKSTWNEDVSDFDYTEADSTVLTDGIFLPYGLDTVNYAFLYDEQVHAAYVTAGQTFGIVGTQLGLRAEQAFTEARLDGGGAKAASLSPTTTSASTRPPTSLWKPTGKTPSA